MTPTPSHNGLAARPYAVDILRQRRHPDAVSRRHSQVVRQRFAKPPFTSSTLVAAFLALLASWPALSAAESVAETRARRRARVRARVGIEVKAGKRQRRTVVGRAIPTIERFIPESGHPGARIELHGNHLLPGVQLWLAGRPLSVDYRGPRLITTVIPVGARSGRFRLRQGRAIIRVKRPFTVLRGPAPVPRALTIRNTRIRRFWPRRGRMGTRIRVTGRGFHPTDRLEIGPVSLAVQRCTPNLIEATLPAGVRSGPIRVVARARLSPNRVLTSLRWLRCR